MSIERPLLPKRADGALPVDDMRMAREPDAHAQESAKISGRERMRQRITEGEKKFHTDDEDIVNAGRRSREAERPGLGESLRDAWETFRDANRGAFERLSEPVRERAKELFSGVKMDIVDHARLWGGKTLYEIDAALHGGDPAQKLENNAKQIKAEEATLQNLAGSREKIGDEWGTLTPDVQKKFAEEERKAQQAREEALRKRPRLAERQEAFRLRKDRYEEDRKKMGEEIVERINEQTRPYEQKLEPLRRDIKSLDIKIADAELWRVAYGQAYADAELGTSQKSNPAELYAYQERLQQARKALGEADRILSRHQKERGSIKGNIDRLAARALGWQEKKNAFAKLTGLEVAPAGSPQESSADSIEARIARLTPDEKKILEVEREGSGLARKLAALHREGKIDKETLDIIKSSVQALGQRTLDPLVAKVGTERFREIKTLGKEVSKNEHSVPGNGELPENIALLDSENGGTDSTEQIREMTPKEYVEVWNGQAERKYRINAKEFLRRRWSDVTSERPLGALENSVVSYFVETKLGRGRGRKERGLLMGDLDSIIKKIRVAE